MVKDVYEYPTVKELVEGIMTEAESIIHQRLAGMG